MKRNLIHRFSVRQVVINIISLSCQLPFIRLQNEICSKHNAVSLCTKQGLQMHLSRTLSNNGGKKHHNLKIVPSSKERLMRKQDTQFETLNQEFKNGSRCCIIFLPSQQQVFLYNKTNENNRKTKASCRQHAICELFPVRNRQIQRILL